MRASTARLDGEHRLGIWLAFTFGCVFMAVILALACDPSTSPLAGTGPVFLFSWFPIPPGARSNVINPIIT